MTKYGWVADGAITVAIGEVSETAQHLLTTSEAALHAAVEQARPRNRLSDISHAVQTTVEAEGLEVIRSLVGHGIGRDMHEDPQVPNFGPPGRGPELEPGMAHVFEVAQTIPKSTA